MWTLLVGGPLYALPSLCLMNTKLDRFTQEVEPHSKTHVRTLEDLVGDLTQPQCRTKWKRSVKDIQIGDVRSTAKGIKIRFSVLGLWRVSKTNAGPEQKYRAADLFIADKMFRRPVHRLVRLLGENKEFHLLLLRRMFWPPTLTLELN